MYVCCGKQDVVFPFGSADVMTNMLVSVDPALVEIRTVQDLIALYQSRLSDPSITSYSEMMLMTDSYQAQAFALATTLVGELSECASIVEIGCGCGCFLAYLRAHGFRGTYLGIDLVAGFVEKAKKRFSADNAARFIHGDFLQTPDQDLPRHDYYVAVSVFGYVPEEGFMRAVVKKACRMAGKSVVMTCNSAAHQVLAMNAKKYSPSDVLSLCIEYGKSVDFKHRCIPIGDSHYAMIGAMIDCRPIA